MTIRERVGQFLTELGNNQFELVICLLTLLAIAILLAIMTSGSLRKLKQRLLRQK